MLRSYTLPHMRRMVMTTENRLEELAATLHNTMREGVD